MRYRIELANKIVKGQAVGNEYVVTQGNVGNTGIIARFDERADAQAWIDFTYGYLVCALWSSTDNSRDDGGDPLDANYDVDDIADEALTSAHTDCTAFLSDNAEALAQYVAQVNASRDEGGPWAYAGHDFWLTRNGHGAGFWDRGLGTIGEELTKASKPYGTVDLYVGDDGKVYGG